MRAGGCDRRRMCAQNVEIPGPLPGPSRRFGRYEDPTSRRGRVRAPDLDVLRGSAGDAAVRCCGGARQLLALGMTRRAIKHDRSRAGRLIRVHQGVYAVGHGPLRDRGRVLAALLAAGPGAALSHRTAAHLWTLIPSLPPFIHVTLIDRVPRGRARPPRPPRATLGHHGARGLPVTTPAQTLAQLPPGERDRARAEALIQGLIPRSADDPAEPTRSTLERALLPAPAASCRAAASTTRTGHEVDFHWPEHRVIVETDGWRFHRQRRRFASDRAQDAKLQRPARSCCVHLAPGDPRDAARDRPHRPGATLARRNRVASICATAHTAPVLERRA